jgi:hypothetical protein
METPPDEKMQKTDLEVASKSLGSEDVVPGSLEEQHKTKVESIRERFAVLRFAHGIETFLDKKVGMETQGIDRMAEDERRSPPMWNVFVLWCGSNICVQTLPFGVLGPELGLSLHLSVAAIVVGSLLGAACTAFTSSLGPKVRQLIEWIARRVLNKLTFFPSLASERLQRLDIPSASMVPNSVLASRLSSTSDSL